MNIYDPNVINHIDNLNTNNTVNEFKFIANNELHVIIKDNKNSLCLQHKKYYPKTSRFVSLDNIMENDTMHRFTQKRKYFYNEYQQRLYMITLQKSYPGGCNIIIGYIDDLNQWNSNNRWRLENERYWTMLQPTHVKSLYAGLDDKYFDEWECTLVYEYILMIVIRNMVIWIDLKDNCKVYVGGSMESDEGIF